MPPRLHGSRGAQGAGAAVILLQLALDTPEAFAVVPQIRDGVDVIEVGTPLRRTLVGAEAALAIDAGLLIARAERLGAHAVTVMAVRPRRSSSFTVHGPMRPF